MNAGAYGKEMKDILVKTRYMTYDGKIKTIDLEEHNFEYRNSIFSKIDVIILETVIKAKRGKKEEIQKRILENEYNAVWLTSPVFCTNIVFNKNEMNKLDFLLKRKTYLICDESLASIYMQISPHLINNEYLFSIYSPHKVLGTNAMKFSCIITHQIHQSFFDMWTDLFAGGMSISSEMAITHFLSSNYEHTLNKGLEYIHQNYIAVEQLLQKHQKYCSYTHASGIYMTIMIKNVPYDISTKYSFIKSLIESTNVSLLPGYLEGFFQDFGFCFRINMTLDRTPLLFSLEKVLVYLEKEYL